MGKAIPMKRVFVLTSHSLFGQGVESLLRQETDLDIIGCETEVHQALARIRKLQPDVVIFDNHHLPNGSLLAIVELLRTTPHVKVIGLDLKENTFHIYQAVRREVKSLSDLVDAI
jgi:DNA-binding NarL/FixJ family response regulator